MTQYYKAKRQRNKFKTEGQETYKLSRSKLELFLNCPRCFYLDRRLGIGQPPGFPFNLNSAVDTLLKKEFDLYRQDQLPHPLLIEQGIDAIPFLHPKMDEWRDALRRGIQYAVPHTSIVLTGGIDDIWINPKTQELIIVDYKATSKTEKVSLNAAWQIGYKRQAEIYQWLFKQNGFKVSNTAYFVYCNGRTDVDRFDKHLHFDITILPYQGKTDWVEKSVRAAYACLLAESIPSFTESCDFCQYILAVSEISMSEFNGVIL